MVVELIELESFINSQLKLEADAREALPFVSHLRTVSEARSDGSKTFDYCTKPLGALKQNVFSCLTCNPPPESPEAPYTPAGICYACSISCHGEHTLVELFARRNFVCDCGTTKLSDTSPCTLRINAATGRKGAVTAEEPVKGNVYNQNYRNRFCGCGEWYDPHQQKGTMFQCVGLATEEQGGCGEDWWHPECLLGLPRDWHDKKSAPKSADDVHKEEPAAETKENGEAINVDAGTKQEEAEDAEEHPVPPGFPDEDEFDNLVCYKCVTANPWIKKYANSEGFRSLEFQIKAQDELSGTASNVLAKSGVSPPPEVQDSGDSRKRKAEEDDAEHVADAAKKAKIDGDVEPKPLETPAHAKLPETPAGVVSIVSLDDKFRSRFCRCAECFPDLGKHPQLLEEEETYEPPLSDDGKGDPSVGTGSLLDRGEAALSNVDRVRAIGKRALCLLRDND